MFTRCSTCASMSATISVLPPLHRESDIAEEDDRVGEKQAPEVALREGPIAPDDLPGVDLEDVPIEPGFRGWLDLAGVSV